MFSVEPTLERTFLRSGAEVLVVRRLGLGAEELDLAEMGFFSMEGVTEDDREGTGVGLGRLGATPAGTLAPETVVLFFTELVDVFFVRFKSTGVDFVVIFLTSAGFPSVLMAVGLLGSAVVEVRLLGPAEARVVATVVFGPVWMLLEPGLVAEAEACLDGDTRFSVIFASVVGLGLTSFEGKVEDLVVVAAGRLGGAAGTKPEARLMGFLFNPPEVMGAGCLGREVGCVLAFDVEVFAG